jgi:hypothetical protein
MIIILNRNKVRVYQLMLLWERVVELSRKAEIDFQKSYNGASKCLLLKKYFIPT